MKSTEQFSSYLIPNFYNYTQVKKLLFVNILLYLSQPLLGQTEFFVKPNGTGKASLTEVKNSIRNITSKMNSNITVNLETGTYFLSDSLTFDQYDGGTGDFKVIYRAAPGAKPIISGGKVITGWEEDPNNGNLYRVKIPDISHIRNLYINNKRAKRARSSAKSGKIYSENKMKLGIIFKKNEIENYVNKRDGLEISYSRHWRDFYFVVDSIYDGNKGINSRIKNDEYLVYIKNFNWSYLVGYKHYAPGNGGDKLNSFYFENTIEELDQPGEWCYNDKSQELYYYPLQNENTHNLKAVIPNIERLISIKPEKGLNEHVKVRNLTFQDIEFAHNNWSLPSNEGFVGRQGSAFTYLQDNGDTILNKLDFIKKKIPGAIRIDGAENITFRNNFFHHIGTSAIDIFNRTENIEIFSNSFIDISASAISMAWFIHKNIDVHKGEGAINNTRIFNNYIERTGQEFRGSPGIEAFYVSELKIKHNELYNISYSGISIGWGWSNPNSTLLSDQIAYNKITGTNQRANDGGSIYNLGQYAGRGLVIKENYINELSLLSPQVNEGAIYPDEGSSNVIIKKNVVKTNRAWVFCNYPRSIIIDSMFVSSNNYIVKNRTNHPSKPDQTTNVKLNSDHIWSIEGNDLANRIMDNSGIQINNEPPVYYVNVALNGTLLSSSDSSPNSLSKANDDNSKTSWLSKEANGNAWCSIDLGAVYNIDRIELVSQQNNVTDELALQNFQIEGSNNSSFSNVRSDISEILFTQKLNSINHHQTLTIASPGAFRYIRVKKTVANETLAIAELRVFVNKSMKM